VLLEKRGGRHVRREHAFLDEAVRVVRSTRTIFSILPLSSKIMRVSTDSKSIAPRFRARPASALKTA
jgi:hypothetical protein